MPSPLIMPVTMITAGIFGLMLVALGVNVVRGRFKHLMAHGDQGNQDMLIRMRTQANFIEYVPMALILFALVESSGADQMVLAVVAALFVLLRISHAFGMAQKQPAYLRRIGAMGTFLTLIGMSVWTLAIAVPTLTA